MSNILIFISGDYKSAETSRNYCAGNQTETIQNYPKPPRSYPKLSGTTRNYFKPTQNFPKLAIISSTPQDPPSSHRATSRQLLPCFSVTEFEHKFIVRKVKLGKDDENPSYKHEAQIVDHLSHLPEISLKQVVHL